MGKQNIVDLVEGNKVIGLRLVLQKANDLNITDRYGDPLVILALHKGHIQIAKILIQAGVDTNLKDANGQTALHHAAAYGNYDIAQTLLKGSGSLIIEDAYGNQPLWTAVLNVKKDLKGLNIVELYLKHGADKHHKNNAGKSPLDFANQVKFDPLSELLDMSI